MDQHDQDQVLYAMVEGLHAMIYGVYSTNSDDYARKALGDGGSIHEFVHAMLRLLPARLPEQIQSGGISRVGTPPPPVDNAHLAPGATPFTQADIDAALPSACPYDLPGTAGYARNGPPK